jgi:hypothetical protein
MPLPARSKLRKLRRDPNSATATTDTAELIMAKPAMLLDDPIFAPTRKDSVLARFSVSRKLTLPAMFAIP